MRYLFLLYGDESGMAEAGSAELEAEIEAEMAAYGAFEELASKAIVGGEALHDSSTCRTIRHDGATVRVTNGPFAETVEALGGFYVMDASTLDEAIELARNIPAANNGAVEIRPMVQWFDRSDEVGAPTEASSDIARYLATIHGPESQADVPGTEAWDEGAATHGRFVEGAAATVMAGGAVQPAATATTVRVRDGELLATDGPFSETTEVVGGFYVLRGSADDVATVATRIPVNEKGAVELRPIMEIDG